MGADAFVDALLPLDSNFELEQPVARYAKTIALNPNAA